MCGGRPEQEGGGLSLSSASRVAGKAQGVSSARPAAAGGGCLAPSSPRPRLSECCPASVRQVCGGNASLHPGGEGGLVCWKGVGRGNRVCGEETGPCTAFRPLHGPSCLLGLPAVCTTGEGWDRGVAVWPSGVSLGSESRAASSSSSEEPARQEGQKPGLSPAGEEGGLQALPPPAAGSFLPRGRIRGLSRPLDARLRLHHGRHQHRAAHPPWGHPLARRKHHPHCLSHPRSPHGAGVTGQVPSRPGCLEGPDVNIGYRLYPSEPNLGDRAGGDAVGKP